MCSNVDREPHSVVDSSMLCPTEKDSGMLMFSAVINVHMFGWEGGKGGGGGWARRSKMRQLTLSMGPAGVEVRFFVRHNSK
jgi:hypothetical protein